jgi:hypothetical protein
MKHLLAKPLSYYARRAIYWADEMSASDHAHTFTFYFSEVCQWNEYRLEHHLPDIPVSKKHVFLKKIFMRNFGVYPCTPSDID